MIARIGHLITLGGWAIAVLIAARLAFGLYRFARLPRAAKRNYPAALWAKFRWRWLTRNLNLAFVDKHGRMVKVVQGSGELAPVVRFPRARFRADEFGIIATVRTIPGVGRVQLEKNAAHIADAWRCVRVQVSQPRPGRVLVRGLRSDPLLVPYSAAASPINCYGVSQIRRLYIGRDEWGADRSLALSGVTGITVGGLPGYGKSSLVALWLMQLAESDAVQFVIIDGKDAGDYADWQDRAWIYTGDDLARAAAAFEDAHALMRSRFGYVAEATGYRNAWHAGPSRKFPLVVVVIDECHTFFDLDAVKGDRQAEAHVRACRALTGQLVKKGRSVLFLTLLLTQKQTGDAVPTAIRDNCGLGLSFAVKTREAAVAGLGDQIREWPGYCPTGLQDPAYIGVATATLRTGHDPFVRVRVPEVSPAAAAERAMATGPLRADPNLLRLRPLIAGGEVPAEHAAIGQAS